MANKVMPKEMKVISILTYFVSVVLAVFGIMFLVFYYNSITGIVGAILFLGGGIFSFFVAKGLTSGKAVNWAIGLYAVLALLSFMVYSRISKGFILNSDRPIIVISFVSLLVCIFVFAYLLVGKKVKGMA